MAGVLRLVSEFAQEFKDWRQTTRGFQLYSRWGMKIVHPSMTNYFIR
jgi:hypothetical protein